MTTITLTPEQGQTIEQANGQPVRVEDPRNHCTYVLVKEVVPDRRRHRAKPAMPRSSISRRKFADRRPLSFAISPNC